ncbi:MAG: transglycosylase domain-containing protein [bacterium]|nr:transglycosylase domain-containing protein [bacterium]
MSDDQNRFNLPRNPQSDGSDFDSDSDVPFRLPLSPDAGTIHKEDTEDIAALHAADPPLERGLPEDESLLFRRPAPEPTDSLEVTEPRPASASGSAKQSDGPDAEYTDNDVPFRLPKEGDDVVADGPLPNKFVTMPHYPPRNPQETLPGTGGLDPNPDFTVKRESANTVQRAQNTVPSANPSPQTMRSPRPPAPPAYNAAPTVNSPAAPRGNGPMVGAPMPPNEAPAGQARRTLPRKRRRFNPGCVAIFLGLFLTFCGGLTCVTSVAGVFAYARVGDLLNERIAAIDDYTNFQSTYIYDRNGQELYEAFNEGRRRNVNYEDFPQDLIDATIAIEDDSFYTNIGIDIPATTVALLQFIGAGSDEQTAGGSTITQQLVRNVLFDFEYRAERSAQRKAEEILLAIALTQRKDKNEILELYLNEIYYGNLAYGAAAAAEVFFGKDISELTLGEAALLAGLPQAPADLDPLNPDPEVQQRVYDRWRLVLSLMVEEGFITQAEMDATLSQPLIFNPQDVPLVAPHFVVYAQIQLERLMGDLGYSPEVIAQGGYQVYTTLDRRINDMAQQVAADQVSRLAGNNISNAAVIVLTPITGEILAMVGSIDYDNDAIDGRVNVTTAVRQPGSTMKPFTYAAAIEQGMTPGDVIWDTRVEIGIPGQDTYVPRNYDNSFHGPMRMRYALANSYNIPAVQTLRRVGVQYLLDMMQRFGVQSLGLDASVYGLSLTLGGGEMSPLELTRAYTVFANGGVLVNSQAILCVLDNDDNIIFQYENACPRGNQTEATVNRTGLGTQVLDQRVAFLISDFLGDNASRSAAMGSNSALYTPSIATSVKTGTTNDVKDNWTVGYTRNVAIGVWVGNNNGDPMVNTSGLTGAAPIWNAVMTNIYNNPDFLNEFAVNGQLQTDQIGAPEGLSLLQVCDVRTLADPATGCGSNVNEYFLDYPAGLPDGQGGLYYPEQPPREGPPASGSYVEEVQPGIMQSVVARIPPEVAGGIQFPLQPGDNPPPPPLYCRVPVEAISTTPGAQQQLFIAPPASPATWNDLVSAEEYARRAGLAFLPTIECTSGLATIGGNPGGPIVAVITSPAEGSVIPVAETPILGTVQFSPGQASHYAIDIIGGPFADWTPLGQPRTESVVNGVLEMLYPPSPGQYRLRLVVVGNDQNAVQPPYEVSFTVQ